MVIYVSFHWMPNSIYNISEQSDTMIFMGYKNGKSHSFRLCLKMGDLTSHGQENDTANELDGIKTYQDPMFRYTQKGGRRCTGLFWY